jgi:hypothetical protein
MEVLADWTRGRRAGPERNRRMALASDGLIPFPGGAGTRNMIRTAKECRLEVVIPGDEPRDDADDKVDIEELSSGGNSTF